MAMLTASCHCGAVRVEVPRKPRSLTGCNCSICRRYGALWAYYRASELRISSASGATSSYCWGDKSLRFVRCNTCSCIMYWAPLRPKGVGKMGVNARNFEPDAIRLIRIRRLDGASTWKYLD
jgi:hypothetical protein